MSRDFFFFMLIVCFPTSSLVAVSTQTCASNCEKAVLNRVEYIYQQVDSITVRLDLLTYLMIRVNVPDQREYSAHDSNEPWAKVFKSLKTITESLSSTGKDELQNLLLQKKAKVAIKTEEACLQHLEKISRTPTIAPVPATPAPAPTPSSTPAPTPASTPKTALAPHVFAKAVAIEPLPAPVSTLVPTPIPTPTPAPEPAPAHGEDIPVLPTGCDSTQHGCCPGGRTAATGLEGQGCANCTRTLFGCCPDNKTPAHGPFGEGCCLSHQYGCCSDHINTVSGLDNQNCSCQSTPFGCCSDQKTTAHGPDNEGCVCEIMPYGCCPDKLTPATGPKFEDCACHTMQFGCCPDGLTVAQGPHHYGCHCSQTEYKCCGDERTPAKGPNAAGCTCAESEFGCCPDGIIAATDDKFGGCENVVETPQKAFVMQTDSFSAPCEQPLEPGPCQGNFERWYYDNVTDMCRQFQYGGCKGNKNNYPTDLACNYHCRQPGVYKDYCSFPKQPGDCSEQHARWHFDEAQHKCMPFYYSGCGGNQNNFRTRDLCEDHCPKQIAKDICEIPAEVGECTNWQAMWYYDTKDERCLQYYWGGCGGNENRFATKEACLQRCEKKPEPDCNLPSDGGECRNFVIQWFYDGSIGVCVQFFYGGCGGNNNRFGSEGECTQSCSTEPRPEPQPEPEGDSVCDQPVEVGKCDNNSDAWYFDRASGNCTAFTYSGCGGNGNRFESKELCDRQCGEYKGIEPPVADQSNNEVVPNTCKSFEDECRQLRCPFGTRRAPAENDCSHCECENPCEQYSCPKGQRCAVDTTSETSRQFVPVCRETNKPGECPRPSNSSNCARKCYTDADCRDEYKCCSDGCGHLCVRPSAPTIHTTRPATPVLAVICPGEAKAALEPKTPQELEVQAAIGSVAVLRCFPICHPAPTITWSRQNVVIARTQGRFVLTSAGDLIIVQVRQTDTGSYVCVASNSLGEPVQREVQLDVTVAKDLPAYIYGEKMFRSIQLQGPGPYAWEMWNGVGRPSSMKAALKAIGPACAVNNGNTPYLQYTMDPDRVPQPRPTYPNRPSHVLVVPAPFVFEESRPQVVRPQAVISADPRNSYVTGSTISLVCAVQRYPTPIVTWTKNSQPLWPSDRIQITAAPHRLIIQDVNMADTGL